MFMGIVIVVFFHFFFFVCSVVSHHVVRKAKWKEIQQHADKWNSVDQLLKNMLEKKVITSDQAAGLQVKVVERLSMLRRQQVLLDLLWADIEGPAFLNCTEHVHQDKFSANLKHCISALMPVTSFQQILSRNLVDPDLLQSDGWVVMDFDGSVVPMVLSVAETKTPPHWLQGKFFLEFFDAYNLHDPKTSAFTLRFSFVNSALKAVMKKERAQRSWLDMNPSEQLVKWFQLWIEYVQMCEQSLPEQSNTNCQIRLWLTEIHKKQNFLAPTKKQKT